MSAAVVLVLVVAALTAGFMAGRRPVRVRRDRVPLTAPADAATDDDQPTTDPGVANVVNLLNNRLAGITGMLTLVSREPLSDAQRRTLEAAGTEARQAAAVVRDLARHLLDRREAPTTERTDLRAVFDDVLLHHKSEIAALGIDVTADTARAVAVSGSRILLIDAINAMLGFAIDRLREAPGTRRVTWDAQPIGGSLIVTQTDSGPVVAPGDAAALLDPFAAPDEAPRQSRRLALARRAIDMLGGTITVGPGAAGGAHVTVTLWADATAHAEPKPAAAPERAPEIPAFSGARILLVEDDPLNQEALAQFFEFEGHHVTVASNGVEALNRMARADFDAVVVDLQMPVLGGRGLYEQTVERFPHMGSRFVFVTGDSARGSSRDFLAQSGQPAVIKPFEPRELMAAVYQATQSRRRNPNWH